jgi:hypothetical protein
MPPQPATSQSAHDVLGWALLPLRAFLGFTFCYAGLSKLANPGFFDATSPISIQAQLAGAAQTPGMTSPTTATSRRVSARSPTQTRGAARYTR